MMFDFCGKCDFLASDRRDYSRHCKTKKHKTAAFTCEFCKKNYKYRSGLSRHLQKCKKRFESPLEDGGENIVENTELTPHVGNEAGGMTELIMSRRSRRSVIASTIRFIANC